MYSWSVKEKQVYYCPAFTFLKDNLKMHTGTWFLVRNVKGTLKS